MKTAPSILLIDDDAVWLEGVAEYLEGKGLPVRAALGPRRGLAILEESEVLVAVLDLHMAEMNGLDLLRLIRRRWRAVRVFLLSSEDDPRVAARGLAEGARAFLSKTKPPWLLLPQLLRLLKEALAEARLRRSPRWDRLLPPPEREDGGRCRV
jgi:CheY-like chemotaxis protein